jgi:hypothetical protein
MAVGQLANFVISSLLRDVCVDVLVCCWFSSEFASELGPEFPQQPPILRLHNVSHRWVDPATMTVHHPDFSRWNSQMSLKRVIEEVRAEFGRNPPVPINASPSPPPPPPSLPSSSSMSQPLPPSQQAQLYPVDAANRLPPFPPQQPGFPQQQQQQPLVTGFMAQPWSSSAAAATAQPPPLAQQQPWAGSGSSQSLPLPQQQQQQQQQILQPSRGSLPSDVRRVASVARPEVPSVPNDRELERELDRHTIADLQELNDCILSDNPRAPPSLLHDFAQGLHIAQTWAAIIDSTENIAVTAAQANKTRSTQLEELAADVRTCKDTYEQMRTCHAQLMDRHTAIATKCDAFSLLLFLLLTWGFFNGHVYIWWRCV